MTKAERALLLAMAKSPMVLNHAPELHDLIAAVEAEDEDAPDLYEDEGSCRTCGNHGCLDHGNDAGFTDCGAWQVRKTAAVEAEQSDVWEPGEEVVGEPQSTPPSDPPLCDAGHMIVTCLGSLIVDGEPTTLPPGTRVTWHPVKMSPPSEPEGNHPSEPQKSCGPTTAEITESLRAMMPDAEEMRAAMKDAGLLIERQPAVICGQPNAAQEEALMRGWAARRNGVSTEEQEIADRFDAKGRLEKAKEPCPTCKGKGTLEFKDAIGWGRDRCPDCEGTGRKK